MEHVLYARARRPCDTSGGEEATLGPDDRAHASVPKPPCTLTVSAGAFAGAARGQGPQGTQSRCCHQESSGPRINGPGKVQRQQHHAPCMPSCQPEMKLPPAYLQLCQNLRLDTRGGPCACFMPALSWALAGEGAERFWTLSGRGSFAPIMPTSLTWATYLSPVYQDYSHHGTQRKTNYYPAPWGEGRERTVINDLPGLQPPGPAWLLRAGWGLLF